MSTRVLSLLLSAAALTVAVRAQNTEQSPSSVPTAPTVNAAPVAPMAPTAAPAPTVVTAAPTPNQVIYTPRLPGATELMNVAAAQGLTVEQINQTSTQVTVVYRHANGQTSTVAYQQLPTATAPAQTVVVTPAPTVVYEQRPRVVYYDDYSPRYYYPPVSLHLGFGYYRGWGGGYHHHHWR